MEKEIEDIPRSIFYKHPIHFRRPQEIQSLVLTVYIVRKELVSSTVQKAHLNLTTVC